jgi:hypothetical protein
MAGNRQALEDLSERPPKAPRAFGGAFVFSSRVGASLVLLQEGRSGNFPAGSACLSVCLFVCLFVCPDTFLHGQ